MTIDRHAHLDKLREEHTKRLFVLEHQAARYGEVATPPHIVIEIEELREKIALIDRETNSTATGFEVDYCATIRRELDRLEMFGIRRMDEVAKRQRLTVAYVTLQVEQQSADKVPSRDDLDLLNTLLGTEMQVLQQREEEITISQRYNLVDRVLASSRRVIIRGDAGSGKTTLLQWIAVRCASHDFPPVLADWNKTVPFFIRLRQRVEQGFPAPEEFPGLVARHVAGSMPLGWVQEQLKQGRAVVLVDGVDELPEAQRIQMLEDLDRIVQTYPRARYIITSRPSAVNEKTWPAWQEWAKQQGFIDAILLPMNPASVEQFIEQWHDAFAQHHVDETERAEIALLPRNLKRLLQQRLVLRRLATNPLLCAMICALHQERRQQLPSERIKLYEECVEMLLSRRDEGRKIVLASDYPDLSHLQKLALIQSFAYFLMQNGYTDIEVERADLYFSDRLTYMNLSPNITGEMVRRLFVERSSLLREPIEGRIDFTHRTFQEFLSAQAAARAGDIGVLIQKAEDDQWRETIVLASGMLRPRECEDLLRDLIAEEKLSQVKRLLKLGDDTKLHRYRSCALAVACLETIVEITPQLRFDVLKKVDNLFPPKNLEEANLVASAGESVVPLLVSDHRYNEEEAAACISALARVGSDTALSTIEGFANDKRYKVQQALGIAWDSFDRAMFARRVLSHADQVVITSFSTWEGFEHLYKLAAISLRETKVSDLHPLVTLNKLTALNIFGTAVKEITPLVSLRSLNWLDISFTPIVNITALTNLTNLTTLIMIGNEDVNDFTPLSNLTNLKSLVIMGGTLSDLTPLSELTNLTNLCIASNHLKDLSPIANLINLKTLRIGTAHMCDSAIFTDCENPDRAYLCDTPVTDLSPLSSLFNITELSISYTQVRDLKPLATLNNLEKLDISNTPIRDTTPLVNLKGLNITDYSSIKSRLQRIML
jgi:hypothetical protein